MPIVSDAVCNAASNPAVAVFDLTTQQCATEAIDYSGKISSEMVCAGETGKGACLGDGGNPLTVKSDSTNQHDLVGVGSWNKGCAAVSSCIAFSQTKGCYVISSSYRTDCLASMLRLPS